MVILKAKDFILRPFKKEDEDSLIENINDRMVSRYMSFVPYPYTRKEAKSWIKKCIRINKSKKKIRHTFAITKNDKVIGGITISHIEGHKADIGYWLGRKYWNQGIMTSAIRLITDYGFQELNLRRIQASVFLMNKPSAKVLEKSGYEYEGFMKKYVMKNGKLIDVKMYAKTR